MLSLKPRFEIMAIVSTMATIFSSFLFSYGVVDIRYSLLVSANKLCFVLIGFGMFPTLFCSVALRTGGTVFFATHVNHELKQLMLAFLNETSRVARYRYFRYCTFLFTSRVFRKE